MNTPSFFCPFGLEVLALSTLAKIGLTLLGPAKCIRLASTLAGLASPQRQPTSSSPEGQAISAQVRHTVAILNHTPILQLDCLPISLALRVALARRGYLSRILLGFAPDKRQPLHAHAWVELSSRVQWWAPLGEKHTDYQRIVTEPELSAT